MPLKDRIIIFVCQPDHRCTRLRNTEHSTLAPLVVKQNSHSGTRPEKNPAYHSHFALLRATKEAGFPTRSLPVIRAGLTPPSFIPTTDGTPMPRALVLILCLLFLFSLPV